MPVEIKELHIRVAVSTPADGPPPGARTAPAGADNGAGEDTKEAIVAACVEQVLQILRDKTER
jgi:hypothetical protein